MRRRIGVALALAVVAGAVLVAGPWRHGVGLLDWLSGTAPSSDGVPAVGGHADLAGTAALGTGQGDATLRMVCDPAGTGLSAVLTVPQGPGAVPFDAAGLTATGGPLTGITVANAAGVRSVRMPARGAAGPAGITLTVTGARREDPLRGIGLALSQPATKVTWTQASPHAGDPALTATFAVAEADAAALKGALGGCLEAPF